MRSRRKKISMDSNTTDLRNKLIMTARQVVRESGMVAFNLRVIAERADTSTQAIYTLFGGKAGLIRALYQHFVVELEQRLLLLVPHSTPLQLIYQTAQIYREQALTDSELYLSATTPIATEADVLGMLYNSQAFALFTSFIERASADKLLLPTEDSKATAKVLWAAVHGAVLFEICTREPHSRTNMVNDLLPILLRGLGTFS
ncbi:TetR/AcrR family transcriptional regulator [Aquirhabdus sp.]|uniref:TetR/AcrR family transcriptional regulator n=1 Tax=Aquirhabdus sp. TaxID=2824160 RepID=UPI00396C9733